jgi:uncharacterized protein
MRYFLIFFCFLAIFIFPGCGEQGKKDGKKIISASDSSLVIEDQFSVLPAIGVVSDFENIFLPEQIHVLDSIVTTNEKETSNEIAIASLLIDTSKIKGLREFSKLTLAYANKWGVGKKGLKNGVCIIFSVKARLIRIEVGYRLETKLTNSEAQQIIDAIIIPRFKKADYFEGVLEGLQAVIKEIK